MESQQFLVELTSERGDRLDEDDVAEALARMVYAREADITVRVETLQVSPPLNIDGWMP